MINDASVIESSRDPTTFEIEVVHPEWRLGITVSVPHAALQLGAMLPFFHALDNALVEAIRAKAWENGRTVSCTKGCGSCCRQLVAISMVEAVELANIVATLPADRQAVIRARFEQAVRRLEAAGLLDSDEPKGERALCIENHGSRDTSLHGLSRKYFRLTIPCPFLEDESCTIHDARPLVCREYHVSSPAERCARLFDQSVDRVDTPLHLGDVLTRAGEQILGLPAYSVPLVLALEWAEAHGERLCERHNAADMLETIIGDLASTPDITIRRRRLEIPA